MNNEYLCANCGNVGQPNRYGKCDSCNSEAIADVLDPAPVRYKEPREILGVEREA